MNFDEFCNENWPNGEYYRMDTCANALQIGWMNCKQEVLKILKSKESFIGDGIKTCIKEVEKL
jgi:hypothetical protein